MNCVWPKAPAHEPADAAADEVDQQQRVPAHHPFVAQRELAGGIDLAAETAIAGIAGAVHFGEQVRIGLDDTRAVNGEGAVVEALAPLSLQ